MKNKVKGMAKDVALIGVQCVRFGAAVMTLCYNGVYLIDNLKPPAMLGRSEKVVAGVRK